MKRYIFLICGLISLTLAVMGIVVPGLPTTPLLLLSTWLFTRSSPRMLNFIMRNKRLARYINRYQEQKGMTKRQKTYAICFMWVMVAVSIFLRIDNVVIKYILLSLAVTGTLVMGFIVPTYTNKDTDF